MRGARRGCNTPQAALSGGEARSAPSAEPQPRGLRRLWLSLLPTSWLTVESRGGLQNRQAHRTEHGHALEEELAKEDAVGDGEEVHRRRKSSVNNVSLIVGLHPHRGRGASGLAKKWRLHGASKWRLRGASRRQGTGSERVRRHTCKRENGARRERAHDHELSEQKRVAGGNERVESRRKKISPISPFPSKFVGWLDEAEMIVGTCLPLVVLLRFGFGGAPSVRHLADPEAFRALVQGTDTSGRAAVVKFSSQRCKACAAMQPRFERLAAGWPELDFHELTYEEGANRKLFRSLGIQKLPYMAIAAGGEAVDGFLCPPKKLPRLELKLEAHAGQLPPHRGWLSGRRWRRWQHRRAAWWRLRPRRLGGRRGGGGIAAQPLADDAEDGAPLPQQQPPAFAPGTRVLISGLASAEVRPPALHLHCTSTAPSLHLHCTSTAPPLTSTAPP